MNKMNREVVLGVHTSIGWSMNFGKEMPSIMNWKHVLRYMTN
jgi:hypothetical protein